MQDDVRKFLTTHAGSFPEMRVIAALGGAADERGKALDALLADPDLEQPVLAAAVGALATRAVECGRPDHWSVLRYECIEDRVFNVVRMPF